MGGPRAAGDHVDRKRGIKGQQRLNDRKNHVGAITGAGRDENLAHLSGRGPSALSQTPNGAARGKPSRSEVNARGSRRVVQLRGSQSEVQDGGAWVAAGIREIVDEKNGRARTVELRDVGITDLVVVYDDAARVPPRSGLRHPPRISIAPGRDIQVAPGHACGGEPLLRRSVQVSEKPALPVTLGERLSEAETSSQVAQSGERVAVAAKKQSSQDRPSDYREQPGAVTIAFITDGGLKLGMGHVQQSLTFAKTLRQKAAISFLTKSDDPIVQMIRQAGFDVVQLASDGEILDRLQASNPDIVIFDKLDVDEGLARDIKASLPAVLVIFTNLTEANRHADIAVTADIGSRFENISYVDGETGTTFYYGPKYWILRPEFYEYRKRGKLRPREIAAVLLMFGGSDPLNLTSVALDTLLGSPIPERIDVILGAQFGHDDDVRAVLDRHPGRRDAVKVHRNIRNVADLMYAADLVVASPGLGAFEALCVGTPVVVMPQDDLQRDTYLGFMKMLEKKDVKNLPAMIARAEFTSPDEPHIARMEIGDGVGELVEVILGSVKTKR
jgi:spore coat polysaccharide biosynthesis predicted glycosyltransferase SpsG